MPIKHSLSTLLCNFKLVVKLFFFIFIVVLVLSAVLVGILSPLLDGFFSELQAQFPLTPEELLAHPILTLKSIATSFSQFWNDNLSMVNMRLFYLWLTAFASSFFVALPMLPITKVLHRKMTTGYDMGLLNAFVTTIKQNLLYCLISSLIFSIVDILLLVGLSYVFLGLIKLMGLIALPLALFIIVLVFTVRLSLFCHWLPEICRNEDKNIFVSFRKSLDPSLKHFSKNFICVLFYILFGSTIFLVTFLPTLGLVPILLIPTLMVLFSALSLTLNYSFHQQKYFTDNGVTTYLPIKKY